AFEFRQGEFAAPETLQAEIRGCFAHQLRRGGRWTCIEVRRTSVPNGGSPGIEAAAIGLPELTTEVDISQNGFVLALGEEFLSQIPVGAERHEDGRRSGVAGRQQTALRLLDIALLERD